MTDHGAHRPGDDSRSCAAHRSHLLPSHGVSYEEVLQSLAARSDVPSSFGHQLAEKARRVLGADSERLERERQRAQTREEEEHRLWHTLPVKDRPGAGYRIDEEAQTERSLFARARVLNCVATLARYRAITFVRCPDVQAFARTARCHQGAVVVGALRAYQQWGAVSPVKGLAALYSWMSAWNPRFPPVDHEEGASQAFRDNKAPKARRQAAALLADADIVLAEWVLIWNRRAARLPSDEPPKEPEPEGGPHGQ